MKSSQKSIIYHHPYKLDASTYGAGSTIRPLKMLAAFRSLGYEIEVVSGAMSERVRQISKLVKIIRAGKRFDFLYSENVNFPLLITNRSHLPLRPRTDYRLFAAVKKARIPQGVFYRDIYWVFPEYRKQLGLLKYAYARFFYNLDLRMYQRCFDVVFLPSLAMKKHFPHRLRPNKCIALPPGTDVGSYTRSIYSGGQLRVLYVGGLSELYNINNLCAAVKRLPYCQLVICCRKNEWFNSALKQQFEREPPANIDVVHLSGEALEKLYSDVHVLALTVGNHLYRTFAMPYKLFEYIAHRCPIICTDNTAAAEFIQEKGAGIIVDDSVDSINKALTDIMHNPDMLTPIYANLETLPQKESWTERAKLVARALTKDQNQAN